MSIARLVLAIALCVLACGAPPLESCGALGRSAPCPCSGGTTGAQECGPAGVWTACACPSDAGVSPDATRAPLDASAVPDRGPNGADAPPPPPDAVDASLEAAAEEGGVDSIPPPPPEAPAPCAPMTADCDGDPSNGCETNTATSPDSCGACREQCMLDNASRVTCVAGGCAVVACDPAFADCDRNQLNGCEVNIRTSLADCGACGARCEAVNRSAMCAAGVCVHGRCSAGFADCDADAANGCETATTTDANCGACGRACTAGYRCNGVTCVNR